MQAVILAAGKSTRTYPLTVNKPKSLLKVLDKTVLEHTLDALHGTVDEVIIVVGFMKESIIERFGSFYNGIKLIYAEQKEQLGTGHALMCAKSHIKDRFLVINGDDLYAKEDIVSISKHDYGILVKEVDSVAKRFGAVVVDGKKVKEIIERPETDISKYANIGVYSLKKDVFDIAIDKSPRGEYEIVDYVTALAKKGLMGFEVVKGYWLPVGYPWNYLEANVAMLKKAKAHIDKSAIIEQNVVMKGIVIIGKDTIIKSGTYIEGPVYIGNNCEIGPHAYLRPDTILMDGVRTRAEIVDSVLMDKATAKHNSYIGHSVIGEKCNIACGTITADYRHDAKSNATLVQGKKVDSGRKKLGAFLGDNVRTGIGTLIYPGRKIWPNKSTLPGQVVKEDIVD
jgi:UDP-N-acetylglucosamine diphosphorylase/glucosamine-1-phosphate N-acetyltransferase